MIWAMINVGSQMVTRNWPLIQKASLDNMILENIGTSFIAPEKIMYLQNSIHWLLN